MEVTIGLVFINQQQKNSFIYFGQRLRPLNLPGTYKKLPCKGELDRSYGKNIQIDEQTSCYLIISITLKDFSNH